MTASYAIQILASHSMNHRFFSGRLQAETIYTIHRNGIVRAGREWVTIDGWTRRQLFGWLGY